VAGQPCAEGSEVAVAVGVQIDFRGATLAQYDEIVEAMGFLPGGPSTPGALFHWVAKVGEGIRFVDVWESRDAYEEFVRKCRPIFREAGIVDPPEVQFFEVHNYFAGGRRGS
jgi:hypothetical protein